MSDTTEFKPMRKGEVLAKFATFFGRENVRQKIWEIVKNNRQIPLCEAKHVKGLRKSEVKMIHEEYA
ncbi:hypothetical protein [Flavobacterium sp. N2820]|uniref:hypothetical protein n=1 Tax=Flavobacterium sp. N2820 TaxID=2986834 RepID=UPI0022259CA5|nr:hypothetical protein [Flavobacterium sp. N2820]